MLGKLVKVTVDRPLGSYHPKHKDMYYPINYGYIEGIIAIIHRYDDVEEKWVVAPENSHFTKAEIMAKVEFTEKYYNSEIIMMDDKTSS